jgi:heme A synthase
MIVLDSLIVWVKGRGMSAARYASLAGVVPRRSPVSTNARPADAATAGNRAQTAVFSALAGLTALGVLLQGVWAGLFVPTGKGGTYAETWVEIHNWGAWISVLLALMTTAVGFVTLRPRRDLWVGALVLTFLLVVEGVLGAFVAEAGSKSAVVIHIPLALVIMSLVVWLPLRATYAGPRA